ncbi:triose-phosphate isomerase [Gammaproteobacteria bacterium]|nr:triose-phosphate isomerase [Gammaproteobacteria bacterium]
MRKMMVAGNWKMHGSRSSVMPLLASIKELVKSFTEVDIAVCPTFLHIGLVRDMLSDSSISLGAQNLHTGESGAYTGEVSAPMLVDYDCEYVLVGHSERRTIFNEDLTLVEQKFKSALDFGLKPIICIGETLAHRENKQTELVIKDQLDSIMQSVDIKLFDNVVIAYEPVWAIGTGLTATPEQAQDVHFFIRNYLAKYSIDVASTVRILYGGSVKANNAKSLFAMPDIDGALVGGASLDAKSFADICEAANL